MRKVSLFLASSLVFAEALNFCGVISNVLQTRDDPSQIEMESSGHTSYIEGATSCQLNTLNVYKDNYGHGLVCDKNGDGVYDWGDEMATATGHYGEKLNIDYSFSVEASNVSVSPSDSSNNVEIKYSNEILPAEKYNTISQDWHHYSCRWEPSGDNPAINSFSSILNSVTISNIAGKVVKIGKFQTLNYSSTTLTFQEKPASIEIGTLEVGGSNKFTLNNFEADNEIKINQLDLKSSAQTNIQIKAPKVVIDNLNSDNDNNTIEIYADEIYIDKIKFAQHSELIIHPYTPGKEVKFYSNQIVHSSSSTMTLDTGDYYVGQMSFHSDASTTPVRASGVNEVVNIYINHDTNIPSGNFLNSVAKGNFGPNPAKNFRMLINGNLVVESAGSTLNGIFYVEGKTQIKHNDYFKGAISSGGDIRIGNANKFYWGSSMGSLLGSCGSHIGNFISGNYDAFDWYNGWNYISAKKVIDTKIVNRDFQLAVLAFNSFGMPIALGNVMRAKFAILNMENNSLMSSWRDYPFSSFNPMDFFQNYTFKIDRATKDARVVFKVCRGGDGEILDYEVCDHECNVDSTRPCWDYSLSSDNFAIMPKEFNVTGSADKNGVHFTFQALDDEGNPVKDYNESVNSTFKVLYSEVKSGCFTGKFEHDGGYDLNEGWSFADGVKSLDLNYSDTGNVKVTIKDKDSCTERFNAVDCNNSLTPKTIASASKTLFIPINHFEANFSVRNFKDNPFTYLANDIDEMNATIELNLSAENYKNGVAKNYTSSCYAKDVMVTFSHNPLDSYFKDVNTSEGVFPADGNITFTISKDEFTSPTISKKIYFNLSREYNETVAPQEFNVTDAFIVNSDNATSLNKFNSNAIFYYGYFSYQKSLYTYSKQINTMFMYEYYNGNRFVPVFGYNPVMGDVKNILVNKVAYSISSIDKYGREVVSYFYNRATPFSTIAHIDIPRYFWFSPFNAPYISPFIGNSCSNHPCQKLTFYSNSEGWGGVNAKSAPKKYGEKNNTILKVKTFQDLNVTRHPMPAIIW